MIWAFASAILLASCENEEGQNLLLEESQSISLLFDKKGIEKAELKEKLAYKNYHLTNLMEEALRSNPDFDQQMERKSKNTQNLGAFYFDDFFVLNGFGNIIDNSVIEYHFNPSN